jgi:predicted O-methyltransferase YrrM
VNGSDARSPRQGGSSDPQRWAAVDAYLTGLFVPADPVLEGTLRTSDEAGLPAFQVSPLQGRLLHLLAKLRGARKVLEIGTLGGYSTIWLARALPPGGRLTTLEVNPEHAVVARASFVRAQLSEVIDLRVGPASETLPHLVEERAGPFDLIFIDADKPSYPEYLRWALQLSRAGTLIVADNVVRQGAVADPSDRDPRVVGVREFLTLLASDPRLTATAVQTVGSKGYDGWAMALVTGERHTTEGSLGSGDLS